MGVDGQGVARQGIGVGVFGQGVPQGVPGTHVAPAHGRGHHHGKRRALHDGAVHRVRGATEKFGFARAAKVHVLLPAGPGVEGGIVDIGSEPGQLLQVDAGPHQKNAAVPEVITRLDESLSLVERGLFDEGIDLVNTRTACQRWALLDVAIARFGRRGVNAEGDNAPGLGRRCGQQNGLVERFGVLNDVVGWHHQHECRGILLGQAKGCQSHRRCCVPTLVFQNECGGNDAQWLALRRHNEAVGLVAHQNGSRRAQNGLRAHQSGLKQGVFTVQSQQLFGVAFA